jgi:hypothetical protein
VAIKSHSFFGAVTPYVHPLLWSTELQLKRSVWGRIFCSPEFGFVYFRVPKSASSTIALTLAHRMGVSDASDLTGARSKKVGKKLLQASFLFPHRLDRTFTFTFVRNPFTRVLSAYLDKIATRTTKFQKILGLDDRAISFREFLERLDDGYLMKNVHWAPQSGLIPIAPGQLSFLGRVETIEPDLCEVMERIFGPGENRIFRRTAGATGAKDRLGEFYGKYESDLVRKLYRGDFERFYPGAADPIAAS